MEAALNQLHHAGWVHGDFREFNILCEEVSKKILILDFEFSGKNGKGCYPFLNPKIDWHTGVKAGGHLEPAHDWHFYNRHIAGKPSMQGTPERKESSCSGSHPKAQGTKADRDVTCGVAVFEKRTRSEERTRFAI